MAINSKPIFDYIPLSTMPDNEGRFVDLVIIMVVYFTTPESDTDVNTSLVRTILATSGFDALVILSPFLWSRICTYQFLWAIPPERSASGL